MNTPLRDETAMLVLSHALVVSYGANAEKDALEVADRILSLVASKIPEGNTIVQPDLSEIPDNAQWIYFKGQKYALSQVKSILKGGTE